MHSIFRFSAILSCCLLLHSCIKDDIIDDRIEPVVRIDNPLESLALGTTYQFEATYLNSIGQEAQNTINWTSSDDDIAMIDNTGTLTALSEGMVIITASTTDDNENIIQSQDEVLITDTTAEETNQRSGVIRTTSSYLLEGEFVMEHPAGSAFISIDIAESYKASIALPGLYLYLTNNPNSINGAYEVGPVSVFSGAHTYELPENEVALNQYSYLLYWCKPFSVKVGEGAIE